MPCCSPVLPEIREPKAGQSQGHSQEKNTGDLNTNVFAVPDMHCAGCIRKLETGLAKLERVHRVRANLSLKQLEIDWEGNSDQFAAIENTITSLGFQHHLIEVNDEAGKRQGKHLLLCLAVAGFAAANIMLLSVSVWSGADIETRKLFALISGLIAVPAVFFAGTPFFASAYKALSARHLNMDVPISLAVLLSLFMSLYEAIIGGGETFFDASVMLLFFLLIGRTLDQLMREKAASGVKSLARLIPRNANRILDDRSIVNIHQSDIRPGMRLRLLPGDRFPVDAKLLSGNSYADRSVVSGEAAEIFLNIGDAVEAGTLNLSDVIEVEAISDAENSFLAEVMEMMKAAESSRGRYRRIADKMASIYAPAVHLLALATFLGWLWFTGDVKSSLVAAIAVLIITCPCALGLAVPVTHVVAANRLFKEGVIMRDGSALERLAEVETVFFDKTGTLTSDVMALAALPELPKDDASVLLSLAEKSRHPVSRAIAKAYHSQAAAELSDIAEIAGSGIEAIWNGRKVRLGRADWVAQISKTKFDLPSGGTLFFIENEKPVVFQLISDLKADAGKAVEQLLESGYPITILSGDHRSNVEDVAARTGIENWVSDLAPKQKIIKINGLRDEGKKVLMIGDGLNDAPSLAAAHVSMAPASATDVSRASADFVYTRQSLLIVPFTLKLSKAAGMIVYQNFALAIAYNCIAVPLAIAGHVTPLIAALAMSASSIVVVANSMRLAIFDRKFSLADSTTQKRTDRLQEMSETSLVQS